MREEREICLSRATSIDELTGHDDADVRKALKDLEKESSPEVAYTLPLPTSPTRDTHIHFAFFLLHIGIFTHPLRAPACLAIIQLFAHTRWTFSTPYPPSRL